MNGLEALPFLREKGHVVSLVGGGGKTTLLYGMARLCAAEGQRVLVSTTTHIQRPSANYAPDEAVRDALWQAGTYAVAGSPAENGKLTQPISEMNVTGNMITLWASLAAVGNDARMSSSWRIPSLVFEGVDFSGL